MAVLRCLGRSLGSVIPAAGAGGVAEIGTDILEPTPVLLVDWVFTRLVEIQGPILALGKMEMQVE